MLPLRGKRSVMQEPRSIGEQPAIVTTRERFGDREVEPLPGKHGAEALAASLT